MQEQEPSGRCDWLDMLEEAQVAKRAVVVELSDGHRFTAHVRDVVTENGEDWVIFEGRERLSVTQIAKCERTGGDIPDKSYDAKL